MMLCITLVVNLIDTVTEIPIPYVRDRDRYRELVELRTCSSKDVICFKLFKTWAYGRKKLGGGAEQFCPTQTEIA